jgi:RNA polymerase-binding transcription factor DksA
LTTTVPFEGKSAMTDTVAITARLRARLAELNDDMARLQGDLRAPLDADFAEQANELEDQDALAGIEDAHRAEATQIRAALGRIAAGKYGVCQNCGCDIPPARLAVLPTATLCIGCVVN